jgi:Na+/H+ antiporter NhaD/arsenite permease-like protein
LCNVVFVVVVVVAVVVVVVVVLLVFRRGRRFSSASAIDRCLARPNLTIGWHALLRTGSVDTLLSLLSLSLLSGSLSLSLVDHVQF